jgi:alpha-L-fucosidase
VDINRRTAIKVLAGVAPALALGGRLRAQASLEIHKGPFQATPESLQQYHVPDWFRDAKFGIWAHWGPQSGVERGDWYARNMYIQGSRQYNYHVAHYGHPTKVGYKDLCPLWKAAEFDPEHLIGLYKGAGAKYFVSMGVHHDNFDLWNSKYTRWNAVKVGPHKDVVGLWRTAAVKHGLRFGVTEHLWISYKWFAVSHGSDKTGPLTGVHYDGADPAYADLYHDAGCDKWANDYDPDQFGWNDDGIPDSWKQRWFLRIQDLLDNYQPDLLYTDGPLPFENYGYSAVANLYNLSAKLHGGQTQAVYTSKRPQDCAVGTCVLDIERGLANQIRSAPWQTDTCIGEWHYNREVYEEHRYKSAKTVVDLLVDIVSQNGNLLLNFPLPNSGQLDPDELKVLARITGWMGVNSEGIYGTRPWKVYGEGPSTQVEKPGGSFNEAKRRALTAEDVRFTTKGNALYAFIMGWPEKEAVVRALGTASAQSPGKIVQVELLGHQGRLTWSQEAPGLRVQLPVENPSEYAITLKVIFA